LEPRTSMVLSLGLGWLNVWALAAVAPVRAGAALARTAFLGAAFFATVRRFAVARFA
jgi:hypothetical protein